MAREHPVETSTEALCVYDECRFCVHRAYVSRTPEGQGQCSLELQGRAKVSLCRGRLFFSLSPDRADKYRMWVMRGSARGESGKLERAVV